MSTGDPDVRRPTTSTRTPRAGSITSISVIIPARNEETTIARCLRAIRLAEGHLAERVSMPVRVTVTVVLDRCHDGTGQRALQYEPTVISTEAGSVGIARGLGVDSALAATADRDRYHWLLTTDADSVVPVDWLWVHLRHADAGAEMLAGLVTPDPAELTDDELTCWAAAHPARACHTRVFGANLGFRADVYRRIGGFPPVRTGEDQGLVDTAMTLGINVITTDQGTVLTSGRRIGRAPEGFAQWLTEMSTNVPGHATVLG